MRARILAVAIAALLVVAGVHAQPVLPGASGRSPDTTWTPPLPCEGLFSDVPCTWSSAVWVEQLFRDGVTAGCAAGEFCPLSAVTRQQMAVFLERSMRGASGWPPHTVLVHAVHTTAGTGDTAASGQALLARIASIPASGPDTPAWGNPWVVLVGPGTFDVGASQVVLPSQVTLLGMGRDATRIMGTGRATQEGVVVLGDFTTVEDLTIQSAAVAETQAVAASGSGLYTVLRRVTLSAQEGTAGNTALRLTAPQFATVEDCQVTTSGSAATGVYLGSGTSVTLSRTTIDSSPDGSSHGDGLVIDGTTSVSVKGCRVSANPDASGSAYGVVLHGGSATVTDSILGGDTGGSSDGAGLKAESHAIVTMWRTQASAGRTGAITGSVAGVTVSDSNAQIHDSTLSGSDYGLLTVAATAGRSVSVDRTDLYGSTRDISNGASFTTRVRYSQMTGGGTLNSGTLTCLATISPLETFLANTCP